MMQTTEIICLDQFLPSQMVQAIQLHHGLEKAPYTYIAKQGKLC